MAENFCVMYFHDKICFPICWLNSQHLETDCKTLYVSKEYMTKLSNIFRGQNQPEKRKAIFIMIVALWCAFMV